MDATAAALGGIIDLDTVAGFWPIRPADISPAALLAAMDRHAVGRACVASARGIWYDHPAGNDESLAWSRGNPRFIPVATIDLRIFAGYREEIRRMADAGVKLWRLFPEYQDWTFGQACFRRTLSALEDAGAVLFVYGQPSAVAQAVRGVHIPIILGSHFYQMGDLLANLEEGAEYYLSTRLTHAPGVLEALVREVGHNRLIYGSNAPLSAMGAALLRVQNAGLADEQRAAILGGNLARLLGLPEAAVALREAQGPGQAAPRQAHGPQAAGEPR